MKMESGGKYESTYITSHSHPLSLSPTPLADKYASQFGSGNQYAYYHDEDETTFHLVDTVRVTKPAYQRGRFRGNMRNMR